MEEDTRNITLPDNIRPTYTAKRLRTMQAEQAVNRISLEPATAKPGAILNVRVPKLNENMVLVPGSLAIDFEIDLTGGHANNFLVQNVTRALISRMDVLFGGTVLQKMEGYDVYKIFENFFLSKDKRDSMFLEGIQSEDLCKIRSGAGNKKTSSVDEENKLEEVYGKKYRIRLDHQILTDHGGFYPDALYNNLMFQITLAPASQVVKGSDTSQLTYTLKNIELVYETIHSVTLANEAESVYNLGKEFAYDYVLRPEIRTLNKGTDKNFTIKVDTQNRSLKAILLLFEEPYTEGTRDSEEYIFPDITKVKVTIKGRPSMVYNSGIAGTDMWEEASRFFVKEKNKTEHMNPTKFYTGDKFGLVIDLRSFADEEAHGNGARLVNTSAGIQLQIERKGTGSGTMNCHIFTIADAQLNLMGRQLVSVQY